MSFISDLESWYHAEARDLPWRKTDDPYCVWISEVILQQTQVVQGLDYYLKFIDTFPNIQALAEAKESEVLKVWQGLGYYRRAKMIHKAAQQIMDDFDGRVPNNYKDLLSIKGIGPYTAGAIASIVFKERVPAVDGNVYRVMSRIYDIDFPTGSSAGMKAISELANNLNQSSEDPGDFNQALMEHGATVCKPKNPNCEICSVNTHCLALRNGTVTKRPVKATRKKPKPIWLYYIIVRDDERILFRLREGETVWNDMYDFPGIESETELDRYQMADRISAYLGKNFEEKSFHLKSTLSHQLSHRSITANFFELNSTIQNSQLPKSCRWYSPGDIQDLPMSRLMERYFDKNY